MSEYTQIIKKIKDADAILIGASNGLSITEGLHLFADNQAFEDLFKREKQRYGLQNILHGMMFEWPTENEYWGFWSRLIHHYCGEYQETQVMKDLKTILGTKDYFVITSNGEQHFEMCGFDENKIYEVEGDWRHMQCAGACHDTVYPSYDLTEQMAEDVVDGRIPTPKLPRCPKCGGPMRIHMEGDLSFILNVEQKERLEAFLQKYHKKKLVVLELGIGMRNRLIKVPLMKLVEHEPNAAYITVNLGEVYITDAIKEKSFGLDGFLSDILGELAAEMSGTEKRSIAGSDL